jgi:hypothetical protein
LIGTWDGDEGLAKAGGEGLGEFQEQVGNGGALLGGVGFMFHSAPSVARGVRPGPLVPCKSLRGSEIEFQDFCEREFGGSWFV